LNEKGVKGVGRNTRRGKNRHEESKERTEKNSEGGKKKTKGKTFGGKDSTLKNKKKCEGRLASGETKS